MIRFFAPGELPAERIRYSVVAARVHGEWLYCRRRDRDTWEMPGGHIERIETPEAAAARELREETGCVCEKPVRVADYCLDGDSACGALFFAELESAGQPDPAFEMAEVCLTALPPRNQTYPEIQPELFRYVQGYLNQRTSSDELWDVLDADRNPTGRLHRRGDALAAGDYHLVVKVWIRNSKGEYLLTRRAPNKGYSLLWETVGGSAVAGDDSLSAAIREVREETGVILNPAAGTLLETNRGEGAFCDVWRFECEFDLDKIVFQPDETCAAMAADVQKLIELHESGWLVSSLPADIVYESISNIEENK